MRFSLKWILAGMAYLAVAAAAFGQGHWAYADLLWLTTLVAVGVAILTAIFNSGARRAAAIGFALFAVGFAVCAQVAEQSIPTRRILLAAGVSEYPFLQPPPAIYSPAPPTLSVAIAQPTINSYPIAAQPVPAPMPAPAQIVTFAAPPVEMPFASKVRATNSISSMFLGLIGAVLAAAVYRRHHSSLETAPA